MARGDNSAVQAIKAKLDLADIVRRYVDLRRAGNRWVAPCPFHQETKPSFSVNAEEGFYYCFGCQAAGDIFDFYARINGLDFRQALEQLAEEAGVDLSRERLKSSSSNTDKDFKTRCLKIYSLAAGHFKKNLKKDLARDCRSYLAKRKVSAEMAERFGLGCSSADWHDLEIFLKNSGIDQDSAVKSGLLVRSSSGRVYDRFRGRLIFPIQNLAGKVIAFGGRAINPEDDPKYINSSDTAIYKKGDHLFGLFLARPKIAKSRRALLTEGYMDVLTLHQFGFEEACGVLGTALTNEQARRLAGFSSRVDLLFDGDQAGRKAALRSCEMLLLQGLDCRVVDLPDGEDIDSLLHKQGREAVVSLIDEGRDGLGYCLDMVSVMSPREMTDWAGNFLAKLADANLEAFYIPRISSRLGLAEADLRETLKRLKSKERGAASVEPDRKSARGGTLVKNSDISVSRQKQEHNLLRFVIRNPDKFAVLREKGASRCLCTPFAATLWSALDAQGFDLTFAELDEKGKRFWVEAVNSRTDYGDHLVDEELLDIIRWLEKILTHDDETDYIEKLRRLSSSNDFDEEALKAIQEAAWRKHGKQQGNTAD